MVDEQAPFSASLFTRPCFLDYGDGTRQLVWKLSHSEEAWGDDINVCTTETKGIVVTTLARCCGGQPKISPGPAYRRTPLIHSNCP